MASISKNIFNVLSGQGVSEQKVKVGFQRTREQKKTKESIKVMNENKEMNECRLKSGQTQKEMNN